MARCVSAIVVSVISKRAAAWAGADSIAAQAISTARQIHIGYAYFVIGPIIGRSYCGYSV
jgi:ABC-type cobalt transport system substrate-binding protein